MKKSGSSDFIVNIYNDPNKDFFQLKDDFYSCHYIKKEAFVFTGIFRNDVNINEKSPLIISASINKNSIINKDILITPNKTNPYLFTISFEEETLNEVGNIQLSIYEHNDKTYPIYSNTITVTKPSLVSDYQTYVQDKKGNLLFNDLDCPLKNISLTSKSNSSQIIIVDCIRNETNEIICPFTLIKGFDSFSVRVDGYNLGNVNLMRELKSTVFTIEKQNCYLLSKDNKITLYTDEYNLGLITNLTLTKDNKNIIVNSTSNEIAFRYNNIQNEIILILYSDISSTFTISFITDIYGNNSTFIFKDKYIIVETHFQIHNNYLLKSNYFDQFNATLEFDSNLNPSDYVDFVYVEDANIICNTNNSNGNKMFCEFKVATLFAPRDFKISLKCNEDLYSSPQTFSIYRYEVEDDTNLCQTKDVTKKDFKFKIYAENSLPEGSNFKVMLAKSFQ